MLTLFAAAMLALVGCGNTKQNPTDPGYAGQQGPNSQGEMQGGSVLGDSNLVFGVGGKAKSGGGGGSDAGGGALGVNAYLWRGALDTLSFMPLASADPFGGVIITDWFTPAASSGERFKATAYILGRELRSDGVRVTIFRQVLQNGQWLDSAVSPITVGEIENKVLSRARQLREQAQANS